MDRPELTGLSLFAGTGMLDLGIGAACDWLGFDYRVAGYAEWEAYAAATLVARMEDSALEPAPVWADCLSKLDARELRGEVDIVCGGPPCQPFSCAGKQQGNSDARAWGDGDGPMFHFCRIIGECRPSVVFIENVPQFVLAGHFRSVGEELSRLGYTIESPLFLTAKAVGASHKRERVFVLAHRASERFEWNLQPNGHPVKPGEHTPRRGDAGRCDPGLGDTGRNSRPEGERRLHGETIEPQAGLPVDSELRRAGLGNAGGTASQRDTGRLPASEAGSRGEGVEHGDLPVGPANARDGLGDTGDDGLGRCGRETTILSHESSDGPLFAPGRDRELWNRIVETHPYLAPAIEPGFRQLVDGIPRVLDLSRSDQLRCVGNGCCPLQAAIAFLYLVACSGVLAKDGK